MNKFIVGVVQATPAFFDLEGCLERVDRWLGQAAEQGCRLVLFPESFLPGYPRGFTFGSVIGRRSGAGRDLYLRYWENSVEVPGEAVHRLEQLVHRHGVYLGIGVTERDAMNGTLYCTLLYFSPRVGLLGKHRKLKPTGVERLVWGEGQGDTLISLQTPLGRLGGLICWENYMPLARMAMYRSGVELYLAPTADARPSWTGTLQHIAREGRCFVLGSNQYFRKSDYPEEYQNLITDEPENLCSGGSLIVAPTGEVLAGPLYDQEGLLTTEIDRADLIRSKMDFDVTGHYSRDDVFTYRVNNPPDIIQEEDLPPLSEPPEESSKA